MTVLQIKTGARDSEASTISSTIFSEDSAVDLKDSADLAGSVADALLREAIRDVAPYVATMSP